MVYKGYISNLLKSEVYRNPLELILILRQPLSKLKDIGVTDSVTNNYTRLDLHS
jgi:hypothetical protein